MTKLDICYICEKLPEDIFYFIITYSYYKIEEEEKIKLFKRVLFGWNNCICSECYKIASSWISDYDLENKSKTGKELIKCKNLKFYLDINKIEILEIMIYSNNPRILNVLVDIFDEEKLIDSFCFKIKEKEYRIEEENKIEKLFKEFDLNSIVIRIAEAKKNKISMGIIETIEI